jgi:CheY-like chemotaxis protein
MLAAPAPDKMSSRPRIIIVSPHAAEREVLADWLASDGLDPLKFSTPPEAADAMRCRPFDLLIADYAFAFRDGLDVVSRTRRRNPTTPTLVVGDSAAAQAQTELRGAMYLARPIDADTLRCTVSMALMDERPVRRSQRKLLNGFKAVTDGMPSVIVDVSPEGLRVEIPRGRRQVPPPYFTVRVPMIGVALIVQRMWVSVRPGQRSEVTWYGGALARNSGRAEQAWRDFVDAIPGRGGRTSDPIVIQ